MTQERGLSELSTAQAEIVLENTPTAIYVNDANTYELLYANSLAQELFLCKPFKPGLTCYQIIGFDHPCPFCGAKEMNRTELMVRKFQHPHNNRIYQLSGKLIDWGGRPAHIEYILDITDAERQEEQIKAYNERIQTTFSSIPCGLCVYKYDGQQIYPLFHNPAFYQIMGYCEENRKSIEEKTTFLGVHPDDLPLLKERVAISLKNNSILQHTYRVWNDKKQEYRWINLAISVKTQISGIKLLYGVYSDVSERLELERELTVTNEKMQDIINAIPGGVAIYKVTDKFETVYFSDGVPELSGYTTEEYQELIKGDAAEMTYWEDTAMVVAKIQEVIASHKISTFEFRKLHRAGHIVWVRVQASWLGEEDGSPLLHCVFHNISDLKKTQVEMNHLVNSIPGGIASYQVINNKFKPTYYSDGVRQLSGHTKAEFAELVQDDALNTVHESDRERVLKAAQAALTSGEVLDIAYRVRHRNGNLIWIHLNGRRMGPLSETPRFYAVYTGVSAETRLFQSIANETADDIYVIDKNNYELLYINESKEIFAQNMDMLGQKCYAALHGKNEPCAFCTLNSHAADGKEHQMTIEASNQFYKTRFWEIDWNGIPAYVKYVRDITEEVKTQREKDRLEQYFQTVVKNLPGGVAVVFHGKDGSTTPEYLSDGFAALTGMTLDEAWQLYKSDAMAGVHPEDRQRVIEQMNAYIDSGESNSEIVYRLRKGDNSYIWVKNTLTIIQNEGGESRVYAGYHDMTKELEKEEQLRQQYNDLIIQHYRTPGPNALIVGHCNVTQDKILDVQDYTGSDLLQTFGTEREQFFLGLSSLVVDPQERQTFCATYLGDPALAAYQRGDTEQQMTCFIKLPQEAQGRYVEINMNLVTTPDSGDVTGILTVTDVTENTIAQRILRQLSVDSYDLVVDVDLYQDKYTILTANKATKDLPAQQGSHSQRLSLMLSEQVLPKDKEHTAQMFDPDYMLERLKKEGSYSFPYSIIDEDSNILTKNMTVSGTDLRLGRVCLARTDITDSVREQQGLLNVIAYTFELLAFISTDLGSLTLYTRQTVLENLPPMVVDNYDEALERLKGFYDPTKTQEEIRAEFRLENMVKRLEEMASGYDFVLPYQTEEGLRYKQINVLWGDGNHKTVCMVRADVTEMLAAERETKNALEEALATAEEANQAKSDFLSSMSHDIRTPMNAIMGMTALAIAHLDDSDRVKDCLQKITLSSKHLLSLINDILDMNKIERSKITLNQRRVYLPDLIEQLSSMLAPQAKAAGLDFNINIGHIHNQYFYGDFLRINQIMINILGNAIKFTPSGGEVEFSIHELPPQEQHGHVRYCFTIRDTGTGMSEEFLNQMFEPFARSHSATRIEGSGLGLSITKGLVELMAGDIKVTSRLHQGTTFHIELEFPIATEVKGYGTKSKTDSIYATKSKNFAGCNFLVAEDNAINAEILCELLTMHSGAVMVKKNGVEAVKEFCQNPPGKYDAILMDIQMPEMNGYEATRKIRALNRVDAKTIPIIAMTANAFSEDVQASLDAGMDDHIAKPIDVQVLWETLNRLVTKKKV